MKGLVNVISLILLFLYSSCNENYKIQAAYKGEAYLLVQKSVIQGSYFFFLVPTKDRKNDVKEIMLINNSLGIHFSDDGRIGSDEIVKVILNNSDKYRVVSEGPPESKLLWISKVYVEYDNATTAPNHGSWYDLNFDLGDKGLIKTKYYISDEIKIKKLELNRYRIK